MYKRESLLRKLGSPEKKTYEFPLHLNGELFFALFFAFEIINEIKLKRVSNDQHQTMFHHRHQAEQHTQQLIVHF